MKYINFKRFKFSTIFRNVNFRRYNFSKVFKFADLRSLNFKKFYKAYNLKLLEKSEYLIKIQKKKIISNKVKWISRLSEVGKEPIIIIENGYIL